MTITTLNLKTSHRVAMAGDWHADIDWMLSVIRDAHNSNPFDYMFHAGDFGYGMYENGEAENLAMDKLSTLLEELDVTLYITLGNHENWEKFNNLIPNADGTITLWKNVFAFVRGYRFSVNDIPFISLGGAASINFLDLQEGYDWFREEAITMGDIYRLTEEPTSVMITHDAPVEVKSLHENMTKLSEKWPEEGLRYSDQSQMMISAAVAKIEPLILFHGHYHTDYIEPVTMGENTFLSVGLNMNGRARNVAFLELGGVKSLSIKWFDK